MTTRTAPLAPPNAEFAALRNDGWHLQFKRGCVVCVRHGERRIVYGGLTRTARVSAAYRELVLQKGI